MADHSRTGVYKKVANAAAKAIRLAVTGMGVEASSVVPGVVASSYQFTVSVPGFRDAYYVTVSFGGFAFKRTGPSAGLLDVVIAEKAQGSGGKKTKDLRYDVSSPDGPVQDGVIMKAAKEIVGMLRPPTP